MSLQTLILDVLIEILSYIEVRDILSLQCTCKGIGGVTQLHTVWKNVLEKRIIPSGQSVSLPSNVPLSDQSALDLKRAAIYAARLEHNWTSVTPRVFARTQFYIGPSRVNSTFFIPGHSGKYLLTVSGGDEVSIWYLEPDLRRSWKILNWNIQGVISNAVPNSDGWARATIALSHTSDRRRYITLYNLTFCDDGRGHPTATYEQIFEGEFPDRLEILRGNLIGMYRRFRLGGYLFNYQSQVTIELQGVAAQPYGLCLAKEVLSNCVIIVQSLSISIFALPEIARDTEPRPGEARVFQAQHISTALCSEGSAWSSAVIIPYCAPYPAQRASPPSQPISILIHERETMESVGTLNHFLVYDSPGYSPKSSILRTRSPNNLPSAGSFTETNLYVAQIRTGVHPYFLDVVASPTSGRGLWLEWRSQSIGQVVLFDAGDGVIDDPSGKLSDIGPFDDTGSTRRGSRIGAKDIADAFRDCTDFSLDDGTGRVVVVASHGQVHILQFGTA